MKSKIVAIALVLMMVVGALVLASCSNCPGDGDCSLTGVKWCGEKITDTSTKDDVDYALSCLTTILSGKDCDC